MSNYIKKLFAKANTREEYRRDSKYYVAEQWAQKYFEDRKPFPDANPQEPADLLLKSLTTGNWRRASALLYAASYGDNIIEMYRMGLKLNETVQALLSKKDYVKIAFMWATVGVCRYHTGYNYGTGFYFYDDIEKAIGKHGISKYGDERGGFGPFMRDLCDLLPAEGQQYSRQELRRREMAGELFAHFAARYPVFHAVGPSLSARYAAYLLRTGDIDALRSYMDRTKEIFDLNHKPFTSHIDIIRPEFQRVASSLLLQGDFGKANPKIEAFRSLERAYPRLASPAPGAKVA